MTRDDDRWTPWVWETRVAPARSIEPVHAIGDGMLLTFSEWNARFEWRPSREIVEDACEEWVSSERGRRVIHGRVRKTP